ncbi:hypothetical protein ELI48_09905 [Rhizobium ruizarguesonis]|uniref:hypothetical protein n=1 Tax=Rhizobium ruizarguesonis TaxID=2081791 RepID=UPI00102F706C|nr:hypothetical protein [Rhizobium ruizarguesonis]TAU26457.1 hypothetical protein ELI48_09905 [Rhizobium ruizarguesonis]
MIDTRAELGHWIGRLEMILISRGVLREDGELAIQIGSQFPKDLEDALDGFIENPIELLGLLKICRDARDGRPLSPAVLMAAHLMAREVLQALDSQAAGDFRA